MSLVVLIAAMSILLSVLKMEILRFYGASLHLPENEFVNAIHHEGVETLKDTCIRSELFKATKENKLAHPNYIVVKQKNMVSNPSGRNMQGMSGV